MFNDQDLAFIEKKFFVAALFFVLQFEEDIVGN
jgi:hypothetical protein